MTAATASAPAFSGLRNQLRHETGTWWRTSRWWRQSLIWVVIVNGLLAAVLWLVPNLVGGIEDGAAVPQLDLLGSAAQFVEMAAAVTAVGVVILAQGIVLDDRRAGITEWLLSKPLTRPALLLAKLLGQGAGLLTCLVLLPWIGVYVVLSIAAGAAWPLGDFAGAVALVALYVAFHLALVLFLSFVPGKRGAVLGIPLALLAGADVAMTALPWLANVSPYVVNRLAAALLVGGVPPLAGPVLATAASITALVVGAAWRFSTDEV